MKKLLVPIMVLALVALTVPVWASTDGVVVSEPSCNVSLDVDVTVTKDVTIKQFRDDCFKTKLDVCFEPKARADAEAVKNDLNQYNTLKIDTLLWSPTFSDTMSASFNNFTGIGQSNQAAGSMNNQGNTVAVAYVSNDKTYASSLAAVGDTIDHNAITVNFGIGTLTQSNTMTNSFQGFIGIGQSNQSAGSMNNQNNAVAIAAGVGAASTPDKYGYTKDSGIGSSVAVAASELALNNTCNTFCVGGKVSFTDTMTGSFTGFKGIGQSNQAAGNMNNQANVVSVGAAFTK
jgi:hypothetical protein